MEVLKALHAHEAGRSPKPREGILDVLEDAIDEAETADSDEEADAMVSEGGPDIEEASDDAEDEVEGDVQEEDEVEGGSDAEGEEESEGATEAEGTPDEPGPQPPDTGATVLVTDDRGALHEAIIVRKVTKSEKTLIVCIKDGTDNRSAVRYDPTGTKRSSWRAL